jgi:hypothetical protein
VLNSSILGKVDKVNINQPTVPKYKKKPRIVPFTMLMDDQYGKPKTSEIRGYLSAPVLTGLEIDDNRLNF